MNARNTSLFCRCLWTVALAAGLAAAPSALAKGAKKSSEAEVKAPSSAPVTPGATSAKDEKVDISDIENKYWAPKDSDFSVVQNRTYTKERRLALSVLYGPLVNDGFSEGNSTGIGVNYFFSERMGVQLDYESSNYSDTDVVKEVQRLGGSPDFGRVTGYYGLGFNLVPFYAKMSVLGKKIIYFDMAITPTVGMTNYEQLLYTAGSRDKSSLTYGFDVTQWFFLSNYFAIRADIRQRWFNEEVVKFRTGGSVSEGTKLRNKNSDNLLFLLGVTFFF